MGLLYQLKWGIITDEHAALMERWLVSENLNTQFRMDCPEIEVRIVMLRSWQFTDWIISAMAWDFVEKFWSLYFN